MEQIICTGIVSAIVASAIAFPAGNFCGWRRYASKRKEKDRRKKEEEKLREKAKAERREAEDALRKTKKEIYDCLCEETIRFPIAEETK